METHWGCAPVIIAAGRSIQAIVGWVTGNNAVGQLNRGINQWVVAEIGIQNTVCFVPVALAVMVSNSSLIQPFV